MARQSKSNSHPVPDRLVALQTHLARLREEIQEIEEDLHAHAGVVQAPVEYKATLLAAEKTAEKLLKAADKLKVAFLAAAGASLEGPIDEQMSLTGNED